MEGHFSDYLNKFQEKYQELREQGKDLYIMTLPIRRVMALPSKKREIDEGDGSIKITPGDLDCIKNLFPEIPPEQFGRINIYPYDELGIGDRFGLSSIECILEHGATHVH